MSRLDGLLRLESGLAKALSELSTAQARTVESLGTCFHTGVMHSVSSTVSSALRLIIHARQMEQLCQAPEKHRAALEGEQ